MPARRSTRVPTFASPGVPLAFSTSTVSGARHPPFRARKRGAAPTVSAAGGERRDAGDQYPTSAFQKSTSPVGAASGRSIRRDAAGGDLFQNRVSLLGTRPRRRRSSWSNGRRARDSRRVHLAHVSHWANPSE